LAQPPLRRRVWNFPLAERGGRARRPCRLQRVEAESWSIRPTLEVDRPWGGWSITNRLDDTSLRCSYQVLRRETTKASGRECRHSNAIFALAWTTRSRSSCATCRFPGNRSSTSRLWHKTQPFANSVCRLAVRASRELLMRMATGRIGRLAPPALHEVLERRATEGNQVPR